MGIWDQTVRDVHMVAMGDGESEGKDGKRRKLQHGGGEKERKRMVGT